MGQQSPGFSRQSLATSVAAARLWRCDFIRLQSRLCPACADARADLPELQFCPISGIADA
jgi:hypothetical protein